MASLARFERPEYTGPNRCWPCTVANGVLLLGGCLAIGVLSPLLAFVGLLTGAGTIWLRGYLVPYTPQLTRRVRRALADEPDRAPNGSLAPPETDDELGERTLTALIESRVIRPDGERLHLDEGFVDDWRAAMRRLRTRSDDALFDEIERVGNTTAEPLDAEGTRIVLVGSGGSEAWVSRSVVVAELAAVGTLDEHASGQSDTERLAAARALRPFLEQCPLCDAPVEERDPRRCCGSFMGADPGTVLACPNCDQSLYRFGA